MVFLAAECEGERERKLGGMKRRFGQIGYCLFDINRATLDSRKADCWMPVINHIMTSFDSTVSGVADRLIIIVH